MWQHLQHCSPGGLFAKLQLLCLQTVCFMHNNAVYGYNGTKVIVELLQLISYSSRKRKYLYFAHWSAQRPKRVFGNVPRSLSLMLCSLSILGRQNKNNNKSTHTKRASEKMVVAERTNKRPRESDGRAHSCYSYTNLQSIWKIWKRTQCGDYAAHSLSICRVERTFQAVLWRSSESSHVRTRRQKKHKTKQQQQQHK